MKKALLALFLLALFVPAHPLPTQEHPTRLVLVYLDADNNLFSFGLSDLNEIMSANRDTSYAQVLVLFDGNQVGDTKLYSVTPGEKQELHPVRLPSEADMGDPQLLHTFLIRAIETYKPTYVLLDLRDHGGARTGAIRDDNPGDHLTVQEIAQAIKGVPISILGFDACLMGNVETLYEFSQVYHGLVVASTLTEPGDGRDYHRLNILSGNATPIDVAKRIVDTYMEYYNYTGVTQGVYDLSMIAPAVQKLNEIGEVALAQAMSNMIKNGTVFPYEVVDHINDTIAGTGTAGIHVGLSGGGRKSYQVYLEAGKEYNILLNRTDNSDLDLYVFAPNATISYSTAYVASATSSKPEYVTFIPPVSGQRTIVVDHYSAETTPTSFDIYVSEIKAGLLESIAGAKPVYSGLKNVGDILRGFNASEYLAFALYTLGGYNASITAGPISDFGALGTYADFQFAKDAPYRYQLVSFLNSPQKPDVQVSYTLHNSTVYGIDTITSVDLPDGASLLLYDPTTGNVIETGGDLSNVPMKTYIGFIVYKENGQIQRAYEIGEHVYGGQFFVSAPSEIEYSNTTLSGFISVPNGNVTVEYQTSSGTNTFEIPVHDHQRELNITSEGNITLSYNGFSYTIHVIAPQDNPTINIETAQNAWNMYINATASDDVALKCFKIYVDGVLYPGNVFNMSILFPRNVTFVAEDYAGHKVVRQETYRYNLGDHPMINLKPTVYVDYTVNGTVLTLSVKVSDDNEYVFLYIYIDGQEAVSMSQTTGVTRNFTFTLDYGTHNITVVAYDIFGAEGIRSANVTIAQPPENTSSSTSSSSGTNYAFRAIIGAIVVVIIVLGLLMMRKRK